MANKSKYQSTLTTFNTNEQVRRLRTYGDRLSDRITALAGSSGFLALNTVIFIAWILINTGQFGDNLIFDEYPFGFLTLAVSLEAIILAVFVLISQNRQTKRSEIRSELDYLTDLSADAEINAIIGILERLSDKNNIDISDLLSDLETTQKKIVREHPVSKRDLEE